MLTCSGPLDGYRQGLGFLGCARLFVGWGKRGLGLIFKMNVQAQTIRGLTDTGNVLLSQFLRVRLCLKGGDWEGKLWSVLTGTRQLGPGLCSPGEAVGSLIALLNL